MVDSTSPRSDSPPAIEKQGLKPRLRPAATDRAPPPATPPMRFAPKNGDDVPVGRHRVAAGALNLQVDTTAGSQSMPASPSSGKKLPGGSVSRGRDEGVHYLLYEELEPHTTPPEEKLFLNIMNQLGSSADWAEQFTAIDESRRLTRFAPKLVGSHLRKLVALIAVLVESLRSALAKNALRCMAELFATFTRRMDPEIEVCLAAVFRRAADTNAFIAEEADVALREMCRSATEAKLLTSLTANAASRRAEIRCRAVWGVAMLVHRMVTRGTGGATNAASTTATLRGCIDIAGRAIGDASAEVRQAGRIVAAALAASGSLAALDSGQVGVKLAAAVPAGMDLASFDPNDPVWHPVRGELNRTTASSGSCNSPLSTKCK